MNDNVVDPQIDSDDVLVVDAAEIASATMLGDLMTLVVDEIKAAPDVWPKLSHDQQDSVLYRVERRCRTAIEECVRTIAAQGRATIAAQLEQVTVKDGIKAVVTLSRADPKRHELTDSCGPRTGIAPSAPRTPMEALDRTEVLWLNEAAGTELRQRKLNLVHAA